MNLVQGLRAANLKSWKFLEELERTAKLMGYASVDDDPGLAFSKSLTKAIIDRTETAIGSGDITAILEAARMHGLDAKEGE